MAKLHFVGTTLSASARTATGEVADAFGRSAFNRYYYAAYLSVRELLVQFDPACRVKHAMAPDLVDVESRMIA